jgi:CHAD domain-containing protein
LSENQVHDLRVALRRTRFLAAVGIKTLGKTDAQQFRATSRSLLDALDQVRDCDVALDWLQGAGASEALTARLQRRRTGLWQSAKRQLKPGALAALDVAKGERSDAKKLARRLEKHVETARRQCWQIVERAPEIPIEELHQLRRLIRGWRYLLEVQLTPRQIRRDRCLKTLIEVQETLGAVQNTEVITGQLLFLGTTRELNTLCGQLHAQHTHQLNEALQQIKRLPLSSTDSAVVEPVHLSGPQHPFLLPLSSGTSATQDAFSSFAIHNS